MREEGDGGRKRCVNVHITHMYRHRGVREEGGQNKEMVYSLMYVYRERVGEYW